MCIERRGAGSCSTRDGGEFSIAGDGGADGRREVVGDGNGLGSAGRGNGLRSECKACGRESERRNGRSPHVENLLSDGSIVADDNRALNVAARSQRWGKGDGSGAGSAEVRKWNPLGKGMSGCMLFRCQNLRNGSRVRLCEGGRGHVRVPYNRRLVMAGYLDKIVASARARVAEAKRGADWRELERRAAQHVPRGFRRALEEKSHDGIAVIAELKKASPSKGLIRAVFRPAELARELEAAGAAALSVLTDEEFFLGSLENLRAASAAVKIPCLRKDFIVDEFQLIEARANAADAVLLIVAALSAEELRRLVVRARDGELDVFCEVHDAGELQRALDAGCDLIGVNTRDLRTFKVDLGTAFVLAEKFPAGVVRVAESGIHSPEDVARLRAAGYDAFLIGESLMRAERPGEALRKLLVPSTQYSVPSS